MPREFTTHIAGVRFPNADGSNRAFNVRLCPPGEPVNLALEPKNKHDPHAIAVFSIRGEQLGYLPAERAPWIGGKIRMGEDIRAVFQAVTEHGALIRINLVGEVPTLPQELRSETVTLSASPAVNGTSIMEVPRRKIDRSGGSQLPEIEPEDMPDYIPPDD